MANVLKTLHTNVEQLRQQAEFIAAIRAFFQDRSVMEVTTPLLASTTVTDPYISSIACKLRASSSDMQAYLQTSPEFAMKRLLAAGSGSIYQICQAFRDDEPSPIHKAEFTMLEWYQLGYDYQDLMQELHDLLKLFWPGLKLAKLTYSELFYNYIGLDIKAATITELDSVLRKNTKSELDLRSKNDYLDALMTLVIQPQLKDVPALFVYDYPASQASLAKLSNKDPSIAERFELFLSGIEIANGFSELTNAPEQRQRFILDNNARAEQGLPKIALDEGFLESLVYLPACAGVAVGLDRLFMVLAGMAAI
ncbi:MAG: EF-P lysine aminoacylase GenX [Legionellales bacterium]|jgi:elongation factor P--(R)-beta-lysine ligase|nr:EF-P lysine aminoacylase GenX [Legionellales bacterium]